MSLSAFCALTPVFDQLIGIPHNQHGSYRKYRNLVRAAKDIADKEIEAAGALAKNDELSEVGKDWWSDIPHTHVGRIIGFTFVSLRDRYATTYSTGSSALYW